LTTHGTSYLGLIMRLGGVYETRGDSGFDCVYTANVCTMNISKASGGCVVSDTSLSGIKTELIFKTPAVGNACLNQTFGNAANGFAKSYQDIKIYDGK
ncbi:hypothetical protein QVM52_27065, partial [Pseudomonas mosselii]|uniref:hypothetical protein n=1 Tax=Pseudomonas mosselii TaxID=78327 RepID=UPI00352A5808